MTDGVDDDFVRGDLVEDNERMGVCGQAPNGGVVGAHTDCGVVGEAMNSLLNPSLDPSGALR